MTTRDSAKIEQTSLVDLALPLTQATAPIQTGLRELSGHLGRAGQRRASVILRRDMIERMRTMR